MSKSKRLLVPAEAERLMARLSSVKAVSQFDEPGEPQAATLAHSLTDLERSFRAMLDTLFPKLLDTSLNADELNDLLLEIGEELRHVLYHINDPKFFAYLIDD